MFGLGWLEILLISLLVLLVAGTGRFAVIARRSGQAAGLLQKYRQPWLLLKKFFRWG